MIHDLTINDLVILPPTKPKSISIGRISALKKDIGNGQLFAVVRTPLDESAPNEHVIPLCELKPFPKLAFLSSDMNAIKSQTTDRRFLAANITRSNHGH